MNISSFEVYSLTSYLLKAIRDTLFTYNFSEITPSILSSRFEPGANHSIAVMGNKSLPNIKWVTEKDPNTRVILEGYDAYYLPVSHVVEKQMALEFLDRVYCFAPCLRLLMDGENKSGKHLSNFFQVEIEWRNTDINEVFSLGEEILSSIAENLLKVLPVDFIKETKNLKSLTLRPYGKITFQEALEMVNAVSDNPKDLTSEQDAQISNKFDRPFWVYDYPPGIRDSLYKRNERGLYDTYDLMLPFGYGELSTGGVRPESYEEIIRQSQSLSKEISSDYAEWKKNSNVQSSGFGIGFERLLKFCFNSQSILDVRQYHDSGPNSKIKT